MIHHAKITVGQLADILVHTLSRFPAVYGFASAFVGLLFLDGSVPHIRAAYLCAALGIPISLMWTLLGESDLSNRAKWTGFGTLFFILTYFFVATQASPGNWVVTSHIQLFAGLSLFALCIPSITHRHSSDEFWEFARTLVTRLAFAGIVSVIAFAALMMTGIVLERFDINIAQNASFLWHATALLVFLPLFLAGVPEERQQRRVREYPPSVQAVAQFILVPFTVVSLLTAYLYLLFYPPLSSTIGQTEILLHLIGPTLLTVFTIVVLYPLHNADARTGLTRLTKILWLSLIPVAMGALIYVGQQVYVFGWTEPRYWGLTLSLWLIFTGAYFSLTGSTIFKRIPLTLGLLMVATGVGPWSAYSVSERSQKARLSQLLDDSRLLLENRDADPDLGTKQELANIIEYLYWMHGPSSLQPYYDLEAGISRRGYAAQRAFKDMKVDFPTGWLSDRQGVRFSYPNPLREVSRVLDVKGYDQVVSFSSGFRPESGPRGVHVGGDIWIWLVENPEPALEIQQENKETLMILHLKPILEKLAEGKPISRLFDSRDGRVRIALNELVGWRAAFDYQLDRIRAQILIRQKAVRRLSAGPDSLRQSAPAAQGEDKPDQ